jgi:DNA-binding response OmpR family regulator
MHDRPHILLVEDEPLSRDVLARRLESADYQVTALTSGTECITWLASQRCDLVLMDVAMPVMNGIDALITIRATYSPDSLPVILVSAMVDSEDVIAGLAAGANDYVVKPVNFRVLEARIRSCLRMKSTVKLLVEAERQRVMIETLSQSAAKLAQPLAQTINNLELLMHKTIDDAEAQDELNEIVGCVEEVVEVIEKLKAAGRHDDVPYDERLEMLKDGEGT